MRRATCAGGEYFQSSALLRSRPVPKCRFTLGTRRFYNTSESSCSMDFSATHALGVRLIAKHPLLSAATILTLTIGIGLDAGVFTLVDGMLFRPRVAHDPASFVEVRTAPLMSLQEYDAFRAARSVRELAAWTPVHASLEGQPVVPLLVSCNFFAVYAPARPVLGRVFRASDCDGGDSGRIVVIGEQLWRTRF